MPWTTPVRFSQTADGASLYATSIRPISGRERTNERPTTTTTTTLGRWSQRGLHIYTTRLHKTMLVITGAQPPSDVGVCIFVLMLQPLHKQKEREELPGKDRYTMNISIIWSFKNNKKSKSDQWTLAATIWRIKFIESKMTFAKRGGSWIETNKNEWKQRKKSADEQVGCSTPHPSSVGWSGYKLNRHTKKRDAT